MPWLNDFKQMAEKYKLPNVDVAALVEWQRKDMEALAEANRQANDGIRALIERRNEILGETFAEWQAAVKNLTGADALSKQADIARQGVEKAVANFRELTQLEMQAHTNAWKVVQERMQENMANLQKLLQPK
ncbi:MAG: phasin family protein [Proteobacteria bacterium]|nr:phasin family protein [Pseudomonadota bacterium]